ncbi:MAG: hypothetical protein ABIL46_01735, partial [candidate division WOR-3 bacterium]
MSKVMKSTQMIIDKFQISNFKKESGLKVRVGTLVIFILLISITSPSSFAQDLRITGSNRAEYWLFVDSRLDSANYKDHITEKLKLSLDYKDITLRGIFFFWDPSL